MTKLVIVNAIYFQGKLLKQLTTLTVVLSGTVLNKKKIDSCRRLTTNTNSLLTNTQRPWTAFHVKSKKKKKMKSVGGDPYFSKDNAGRWNAG